MHYPSGVGATSAWLDPTLFWFDQFGGTRSVIGTMWFFLGERKSKQCEIKLYGSCFCDSQVLYEVALSQAHCCALIDK